MKMMKMKMEIAAGVAVEVVEVVAEVAINLFDLFEVENFDPPESFHQQCLSAVPLLELIVHFVDIKKIVVVEELKQRKKFAF